MLILCTLGGTVLPGCASNPPVISTDRATRASNSVSIVLFGEVHDNAAQHAHRLAWLRQQLVAGARPALLMEQLDRKYQSAIDAARADGNQPTVDAIIATGTGSTDHADNGWDWDFYRPLIAAALEYQLPIIAVNVGRDDARKIIKNGLAANGFDANVPNDILHAQAVAIKASHCGMIDLSMASRMAGAQVARDQSMARAIQAWADQGVVLIAGNGHVRKDIGVPRWLSSAVIAKTEVVGMVETNDPERSVFDRVVVTPAQERVDPCEAMRGRSAGAVRQ